MPAPANNKYNQKYSLEQAIELLDKAVEYSRENEDCLSVQDAIIHIGLPHSTFYHLCSNHKELDNIKTEINNNVIARVNKHALKGNFNATAGIWRMKQLGEKDKQEIHNKNEDLSPPTPEEMSQAKKRIEGDI